MSLIADAKSPTANSFITLQEMTDYLVTRANATGWPTVQTTQEALLVTAARLLNFGFDWFGTIRTREQALSWPRSGTFDADGRYFNVDTIPQLIKDAQAELALYLASQDPLVLPGLLGKGLSEVAVGPVRVKVDKEAKLPIIPDHIILMLSPVGSPKRGSTGGMAGSVPLQRV